MCELQPAPDQQTHPHQEEADAREGSIAAGDLLAALDLSVVAADLQGVVTAWNDGAAALYGWSREEAIGRPLDRVLQCDQPMPSVDALAEGPVVAQLTLRHKDGSPLAVTVRLSTVLDPAGEVSGVVGMAINFGALDRLRQKIERDSMTGLFNAAAFTGRLAAALEKGGAGAGRVPVVIYLDLDRFKRLNDSLGRLAGDEVIVAGARRLREVAFDDAVLGRVGGDEFAVLRELGSAAEAQAEAERLRAAIARPLTIGEAQIVQSVSAGLVMLAAGATADGALMEAAHAADLAKARGGGCVEVFDDGVREELREARQLERDLRRALQAHSLQVVYQPIVELRDGDPVALEALVRWNHPELGTIPPSRFVSAAEESTLIVPLGAWIFDSVCEQIARWRSEGVRTPPVALNVSPRQLSQPEFVDQLLGLLRDHGLVAADLRLELTETALFEAEAARVDVIDQLSELGFAIVLDDFGTGYSSLSHLRRFPVDGLKIDRSFVAESPRDGSSATIVEATIAMAEALGIHVVAEGIETEAQLHYLRSLGCDAGQGWLFGRPLLADGVPAALEMASTLPEPRRNGSDGTRTRDLRRHRSDPGRR